MIADAAGLEHPAGRAIRRSAFRVSRSPSLATVSNWDVRLRAAVPCKSRALSP